MFGIGCHQVREAAEEAIGAADLRQGQAGDDQATHHQQGHLDDIRQGHGLEAAGDLVEQSERTQARQHPEGIEAGHGGHRRTAQPQDRGQVDENVEDEPEHRHQVFDAGPEALLQEARHGGDAVPEEHRQEPFADDDQGDRRHPLIGSDGQADLVARSRHADDLFGGNVGGDQRGADGPPRQAVIGQEVALGRDFLGGLAAANHLGQHEDGDGVEQEDPHVE